MAINVALMANTTSADELYLVQLRGMLQKLKIQLSRINDHIEKSALPDIPKAELLCFWNKLLSDDRTSVHSVGRHQQAIKWYCANWSHIANRFAVNAIGDIPSILTTYRSTGNKKGSNDALIQLYADSHRNKNKPCNNISIEYVKSRQLTTQSFLSPRLTIVGHILNDIIKTKEQFNPLEKRNIIYLNDLYSEEETRFKDRQQRVDFSINLYNFPPWYRDIVRAHLLDKVAHRELAPSTLISYAGMLIYFAKFVEENCVTPYTDKINTLLIEDDFIAWGNRQTLKGKNWFTNAVALLEFAHKRYPNVWPAINISSRAIHKLANTYYKNGLGRVGHHQEGAGRAISEKIVTTIAGHIQEVSEPTPTVFALMHGTGMRAEDAHAVLFDCLHDDPQDSHFKILTFWQNKVSKYNDKPLLKTDPVHQQLIEAIETQRSRIISQYGKPTKYLFPVFTGEKESWIKPSTTLKKIKRLCIQYNILDDGGNVYDFTWHPMRHAKGTSMALAGHDILQIMLELGHTSPDMATVYVNNRYQIKKQALIEKGGGKFITIKGEVDEAIATLLVKKEELRATRVCGGACAMPKQIGDWCAHANACLTCKHFRADSNDIEYFKSEKDQVLALIDKQAQESQTLLDAGRNRLAEITTARFNKNKEIVINIENIINAIEKNNVFSGSEPKLQQVSLLNE